MHYLAFLVFVLLMDSLNGVWCENVNQRTDIKVASTEERHHWFYKVKVMDQIIPIEKNEYRLIQLPDHSEASLVIQQMYAATIFQTNVANLCRLLLATSVAQQDETVEKALLAVYNLFAHHRIPADSIVPIVAKLKRAHGVHQQIIVFLKELLNVIPPEIYNDVSMLQKKVKKSEFWSRFGVGDMLQLPELTDHISNNLLEAMKRKVDLQVFNAEIAVYFGKLMDALFSSIHNADTVSSRAILQLIVLHFPCKTVNPEIIILKRQVADIIVSIEEQTWKNIAAQMKNTSLQNSFRWLKEILNYISQMSNVSQVEKVSIRRYIEYIPQNINEIYIPPFTLSPLNPFSAISPADASLPIAPSVATKPIMPVSAGWPQLPNLPHLPHSPEVPDQTTSPRKPNKAEQPTSPNNPGSPVSPSRPGKPQSPASGHLPAQPNSPNKPGSPLSPNHPSEPYAPDSPKSPDSPGEPNLPLKPGSPHTPSNPKKPYSPDSPGSPDFPGHPSLPDKPGSPHSPRSPDIPHSPHSPTSPDLPGQPTLPDKPKVPVSPSNPKGPQSPDSPFSPQLPGEPNLPDKPKVPGSPVNPNTPVSPELPRKPTMPGKPNAPLSPVAPIAPSSPDLPNKPNLPDKPSKPLSPANPDIPRQPIKPSSPSSPATPSLPRHPVQPDKPNAPLSPSNPATPNLPKQPALPDKPSSPLSPNSPDAPDLPRQPDTPGLPRQPDLPGKPDLPGLPTLATVPDKPFSPVSPNLPAAPGLPREPPLPGQPGLPSLPNLPDKPVAPVSPSNPAAPDLPTQPDSPRQPTLPSKPSTPLSASRPATPNVPTQPVKPSEPVSPINPSTSYSPRQPVLPDKPSAPAPPGSPDRPNSPDSSSEPYAPFSPSSLGSPFYPYKVSFPASPEVSHVPDIPGIPNDVVSPNIPREPTFPNEMLEPGTPYSPNVSKLPVFGGEANQSNLLYLLALTSSPHIEHARYLPNRPSVSHQDFELESLFAPHLPEMPNSRKIFLRPISSKLMYQPSFSDHSYGGGRPSFFQQTNLSNEVVESEFPQWSVRPMAHVWSPYTSEFPHKPYKAKSPNFPQQPAHESNSHSSQNIPNESMSLARGPETDSLKFIYTPYSADKPKYSLDSSKFPEVPKEQASADILSNQLTSADRAVSFQNHLAVSTVKLPMLQEHSGVLDVDSASSGQKHASSNHFLSGTEFPHGHALLSATQMGSHKQLLPHETNVMENMHKSYFIDATISPQMTMSKNMLHIPMHSVVVFNEQTKQFPLLRFPTIPHTAHLSHYDGRELKDHMNPQISFNVPSSGLHTISGEAVSVEVQQRPEHSNSHVYASNKAVGAYASKGSSNAYVVEIRDKDTAIVNKHVKIPFQEILLPQFHDKDLSRKYVYVVRGRNDNPAFGGGIGPFAWHAKRYRYRPSVSGHYTYNTNFTVKPEVIAEAPYVYSQYRKRLENTSTGVTNSHRVESSNSLFSAGATSLKPGVTLRTSLNYLPRSYEYERSPPSANDFLQPYRLIPLCNIQSYSCRKMMSIRSLLKTAAVNNMTAQLPRNAFRTRRSLLRFILTFLLKNRLVNPQMAYLIRCYLSDTKENRISTLYEGYRLE